MFITGHTPYALLAGVLFVRGMGLGAAVQPPVAAAYQLIDSAQVPRATAALNTLRQIGGARGTTLPPLNLPHARTTPPSSSLRFGTGRVLPPRPHADDLR